MPEGNLILEVNTRSLESCHEYFVMREQSNSTPLTVPLKLDLRGTHTIEKALSERGIGQEFHYGLAIDVFTLVEGSGCSAPRIFRSIINRCWQVKQLAGFVNFKEIVHFSVLGAALVKLLKYTPRTFIEATTKINKIDFFRSTRRRRFFSYSFRSNFWKFQFSYSQIFPLAATTFAGSLYPIPNSSGVHLEMLFGDSYMTPPKEELRLTHASQIEIEPTSPFYAYFCP